MKRYAIDKETKEIFEAIHIMDLGMFRKNSEYFQAVPNQESTIMITEVVLKEWTDMEVQVFKMCYPDAILDPEVHPEQIKFTTSIR